MKISLRITSPPPQNLGAIDITLDGTPKIVKKLMDLIEASFDKEFWETW